MRLVGDTTFPKRTFNIQRFRCFRLRYSRFRGPCCYPSAAAVEDLVAEQLGSIGYRPSTEQLIQLEGDLGVFSVFTTPPPQRHHGPFGTVRMGGGINKVGEGPSLSSIGYIDHPMVSSR